MNQLTYENWETLSLAEKVGQLFCVGFQEDHITPQFKQFLYEYNVGGVIYFSRNLKTAKQTLELSQELQNSSKTPLFISIDQEGGMVTRLQEGISQSPGNMAIAATNNIQNAHDVGYIVAKELSALGINMNFAPCVDVNNNPLNPVINIRSYGEDPNKVAEFGLAASQGLRSGSMIPVPKHFPGHGNTNVDSHVGLPIIEQSISELQELELIPFQALVNNNIEALMIAHIIFPALEPNKLPSTLSYNVVTELLRKQMGYEGLVITDCMEMKAISDNYTPEDSAIRAILAGADQVLISHTYEHQKRAIEGVIQAVKENIITEQQIDKSLERIFTLKKLYIKPLTYCFEDILKELAKPANLDKVRHISETSISCVRDTKNQIPIKQVKTIWLIPSSIQGSVAEEKISEKKNWKSLLENLPHIHPVEYDVNLDSTAMSMLVSKAQSYEKIIISTTNVFMFPQQKELVKILYKQKLNPIVIAMRSPYDIQNFPEIESYVCCYENSELAWKSLINVLLGKIKPMGKLPVTI